MLAKPQQGGLMASRANWRRRAYLTVVLVGVLVVAPSVRPQEAQAHASTAPANACSAADAPYVSCPGQTALPRPTMATMGKIVPTTMVVLHPAGIGKMGGVTKLAQAVTPPHYDTTPVTSGQPCHDTVVWPKSISQWTVPLGCYGKIYAPVQSDYKSFSAFGYCNWWVEALHPDEPGILSSSKYVRNHTPAPGAVMWFDPGVQGASSAGHWAQVVAIAPDGYWMLITEMNFGWHGGGFGKVDYRFVHIGSGTYYIH